MKEFLETHCKCFYGAQQQKANIFDQEKELKKGTHFSIGFL